jgi:hypothetical protein
MSDLNATVTFTEVLEADVMEVREGTKNTSAWAPKTCHPIPPAVIAKSSNDCGSVIVAENG